MTKTIQKQLASALVLTAGLFMTISCGVQEKPVVPDTGAGEESAAVSASVQKDYDIVSLGASLAEGCTFSDVLFENDQYLANHLFNFAELGDKIAESTAYVPAGITPEEVLVFRMQTEDDTAAMTEKLNAYVEYQKSEYGRYKASEVPKLDDPVILTSGAYVVYVISEDNAGAKTAAEALLQ